MATHRNETELEYDLDDMSAGARLMRYYISEGPRPDALGGAGSSTTMTKFRQPTRIFSEPQGETIHSKVVSSAGKAGRVAESATKNESKTNEGDNGDNDDDDDDDNDDPNGNNNNDPDDAIFRADLAALQGDIVFDIAGRHSHQDILKKIAKFHPQATFEQKHLTWRIANAIVSRANRQGVNKLKVRAELDANRMANGVKFPINYRPKTWNERGGGKEEPAGSDDGDGVV